MRTLKTLLATSAIAIGLATTACAPAQLEASSASAPVEDIAVAPEPSGPTLWKVSDEDTTIYLFGTVHALPPQLEWYDEPIENALLSSDEFVTELHVDAMDDPATAQKMMVEGMLPPGQSVRDLMSDENRASYEAALAGMGIPANSFDQFEPWSVALTLGILPLLSSGWDINSGVEKVLDTKIGDEVERGALETVELQIAVFDEMEQERQLAYLNEVVASLPVYMDAMDSMVAEWVEGDPDGLAEIMNANMSDPELYKRLLTDRNANWAVWIDDRLDEPGTVFVAVGAGHLAGKDSVQVLLADRGIMTERLR